MAQMYRILGKRGRITIPFEIRQRVGFSQNDVLSFTESADGRTVLVKREKLCDDNCKPERAQRRKEETDSVTLFDFLNSLSDEQQCAALYTFATHALTSGVDAKTLSGILGHTNASFTLDTYTHVTTDMQKKASGIVGDFLDEIM